jgi:hypothetical protein
MCPSDQPGAETYPRAVGRSQDGASVEVLTGRILNYNHLNYCDYRRQIPIAKIERRRDYGGNELGASFDSDRAMKLHQRATTMAVLGGRVELL